MNIKYIKGSFPLFLLVTSMIAGCPVSAQASQEMAAVSQGQIVIDPLFDYPAPPDEISDLQSRAEWLMEHFWDRMDFKSRQTVDQTALNHAFGVYAVPMQWASKESVDKSVDKLLKNIRKNPALRLQFAKAAEEVLYGPRGVLWIDEVYLKFLKNALENKKLPSGQRLKWQRQYDSLVGSQPGMAAPRFSYVDRNNDEKEYFAMSTPTLIIFGDLMDPDFRLQLLRTHSNVSLSQSLTLGKVNVCFFDISGGTIDYSSLPDRWVGGKVVSPEILRYDTRISPSTYLIGSDGKIIDHGLSLSEGLAKLVEIASGSEK